MFEIRHSNAVTFRYSVINVRISTKAGSIGNEITLRLRYLCVVFWYIQYLIAVKNQISVLRTPYCGFTLTKIAEYEPNSNKSV